MVFNKEETKNLMKMLLSPEVDNKVLALKSLEHAELDGYYGELIVLFKFSKNSSQLWQEEAPKAWSRISDFFTSRNGVPSGACLTEMMKEKASKVSLELFFEQFVVDMVDHMTQLGFPTDSFNINIKLKDE
jgi:hypothetical protein